MCPRCVANDLYDLTPVLSEGSAPLLGHVATSSLTHRPYICYLQGVGLRRDQ